MLKSILIFSFFFLSFNLAVTFGNSVRCIIKFESKKVCEEVKDAEKCFVGDFSFCAIVKTTFNRKRCPLYQCLYITPAVETTITPPKTLLSSIVNITKTNFTTQNLVNVSQTKTDKSEVFELKNQTIVSTEKNVTLFGSPFFSNLSLHFNLTNFNQSTGKDFVPEVPNSDINCTTSAQFPSQPKEDIDQPEIRQAFKKTLESFLTVFQNQNNFFWEKLKVSEKDLFRLQKKNRTFKKKIRKLKKKIRKLKKKILDQTKMAKKDCGDKLCYLTYEDKDEVIC